MLRNVPVDLAGRQPGGREQARLRIRKGLAAALGIALLGWIAGAYEVRASSTLELLPRPSGERVGVRGVPILLFSSSTAQSEQIAAGQQIFETICSTCHGDRGEGGEGPAIAGPESELVTYRNARRLFEYVQENMPNDDPGILAEQQSYDVVAFLMAWNNLNPSNVPVNAATVEGILFTR